LPDISPWGEQQMLDISRALMARPNLILLDEPSMGLSPLLLKDVFGIIRRLNRELGISILLAKQNARATLKVADKGYVLEIKSLKSFKGRKRWL
jgi:branched-chain amino acid transport system ATP-binding protein